MDKKNRCAFINGKIFTSDDHHPYASAMIVENGIIQWIGDDPAVEDCQRVDLHGKRVLPGFVDAHMHPLMLASFSQQISCLPPKIHSITELVEKIKQVRAERGPNQWILGWGYDEGKMAEKRPLTRYDLDQGCSDAPVVIVRTCSHIRYVNSKVLEMANIAQNTQNPPGGQIDRDENGSPTGVLRETADCLISGLLPEPGFDEAVRQLLDLGTLLTSQGVTAVTDMGLDEDKSGYDIYIEAAKRGFGQKAALYYAWDVCRKQPRFSIPPERFAKDQQVRVAGLKLIGDGSVSGRTAWMGEPYWGTAGEYGMPVCSDEEIESAIAFCKENHCQLSVHAMGARAIDRIVDRVYPEEKWTAGETPHLRVEHVTEPSDSAIVKAAEKGFGFATQPIFPYCEIESYLTNLGPERTKKTSPIKKLLDRGVLLCFSSDSPATSWATPSDPFPSIKGAVGRYAYDGTDFGQDQRVDIETAVKLYTRYAAQVAGFERIGQLKPGYSADFIVLNQDILNIPAEKIDGVLVEQTYISGEKRFDRNSSR